MIEVKGSKTDQIKMLKKRMAAQPYTGYAMFAAAHSPSKANQGKTVDQMRTSLLRRVPPATTARSRQYSFVW